jgi:hypothetical protein
LVVAAPYAVKSSVPAAVFREFAAALADDSFAVTNDNFSGLSLL